MEVAYAFDSDEEFFAWATEMPFGESFMRAEERIRDKQRLQSADHSDLGARISGSVESVRRQLHAMAEQTGLSIDSQELLTRAAREIRTADDPSLEPTILYESPKFAGSSITVWDQYVPDLGVIGWSNRAWSAKLIFGAGTLYDQPWWQGRKFRMFGLPYVEFSDLGTFGFGGNTKSFFPAFVF